MWGVRLRVWCGECRECSQAWVDCGKESVAYMGSVGLGRVVKRGECMYVWGQV